MKTLKLIVTFIIILIGTYDYTTPAQIPIIQQSQAKILFDTTIHNFGNVKRGQKLTHIFNFTNIGNTPLIIYGIHASCGCIINNFQPDNKYLPGQTGQLHIILDTTNFRGNITKHITIITNQPTKKSHILTIKANIQEQIWADPPLIALNETTVGQSIQTEINIYTTSPNIKLLDIKYDPKIFTINISQLNPTKYTLKVIIKPYENSNFIKNTIYVINNSDHLKELPILVRVKLNDVIKLNTDYIEFGNIKQNNVVSKDVIISSTQPFEILKSEITEFYINDNKISNIPAIISIAKIQASSDMYKYKLIITNKGEYYGSFHGQIIYTTTHKSQQFVKLNFYGFLNKG